MFFQNVRLKKVARLAGRYLEIRKVANGVSQCFIKIEGDGTSSEFNLSISHEVVTLADF
jgi:hypothetical protein